MTRLGQAFWAITAIDVVLLVVFLVMAPQQRSVQNDGSREMALFYFIMLPGLVLVLAMLLFHFSTSLPAKCIALFIVVAPGLYFAKSQIEGWIIAAVSKRTASIPTCWRPCSLPATTRTRGKAPNKRWRSSR